MKYAVIAALYAQFAMCQKCELTIDLYDDANCKNLAADATVGKVEATGECELWKSQRDKWFWDAPKFKDLLPKGQDNPLAVKHTCTATSDDV